MDKIAKKIKQIVKGEDKPTFGTDPNDPWSAKAGIAESAMLDRYLKSRGIDPKFVSKDTKVSHAKSGEFVKWKNDHKIDENMTTTHSPNQEREKALKSATSHGKPSALERFRSAAAQREKEAKKRDDEMKARHAAGKEDMKGAIDRLEKSLHKEDIFQDGQAATQSSFDGANAPDNTEPQTPGRKQGLSKSARMIKALYKHHGIKEELYDHEKEDKSVATYGKKPKMQKVDADKLIGDDAPKAAAVLSGGKTLTGQTRDTLEIDPEMKRPIRSDGKREEKNQ